MYEARFGPRNGARSQSTTPERQRGVEDASGVGRRRSHGPGQKQAESLTDGQIGDGVPSVSEGWDAVTLRETVKSDAGDENGRIQARGTSPRLTACQR